MTEVIQIRDFPKFASIIETQQISFCWTHWEGKPEDSESIIFFKNSCLKEKLMFRKIDLERKNNVCLWMDVPAGCEARATTWLFLFHEPMKFLVLLLLLATRKVLVNPVPIGEEMKAVTNFIFLGSKITVDSDYSHEIKRYSPFGRKFMTNLDSVLKSRDALCLQRYILSKQWFFQ